MENKRMRYYTTNPIQKPAEVKEWAILRLKKRYSAKSIARDIKQHFGVNITDITICRWRKHYNENHDDKIATFRDVSPKPLWVKEFVVDRIKRGYRVLQIIAELKDQKGASVTERTILKWRKECNQQTKDN